MNDWTAKYRNSGLAGRPSFSNLYSVVNALAGHWNNFGADAPVPKKRIGRITKVRSFWASCFCLCAPRTVATVSLFGTSEYRSNSKQCTRPTSPATAFPRPNKYMYVVQNLVLLRYRIVGALYHLRFAWCCWPALGGWRFSPM